MEGKFFIKGDKVLESVGIEEKDILGKTNIYEVVRVIDGVALFKENHLERMKRSLNIAGYYGKINIENINNGLSNIIKINNNINGNVKVVINKEMDELFIYYIHHSYPTEDMYAKGVDTILYHGERNNPNAKIIDNSFREKVNTSIEKNKVYEAILVDRQGNITEGSKSNIFMVKDNTLITSPVSKVLPGVTRGEIIELAKELNIKFEEKNVNFEEVKNLDGLFISGTSPNILPIKKVDDIKFTYCNNSIICKLMNNFNKKIEEYIKNKN